MRKLTLAARQFGGGLGAILVVALANLKFCPVSVSS